mgnify:CR=1 FL=1
MSLFMQKYEQTVSGYVQTIGRSLNNQIVNELGAVTLPPYVEDINFKIVNNVVEIPPFEYPRILRDSSILQNDSLMAIYIRKPDGHFENESLYMKSPMFYQHKPHNYYVAILKKYFPTAI